MTYLTFTVNYIYHMDKLEIKLEARTHLDLSRVYYFQDVHTVIQASGTFTVYFLYVVTYDDMSI